MFPGVMSYSASLSEEASNISSATKLQDHHDHASLIPMFSTISPQQPQKIKRKRNLPGNPDPDAEVIALSPKTLLATNRFVCEICNKGFQRDQNLQLHRRGHNLPWKLKQRNSKENRKRAYVCPEPTCVHHHPSRALGDLTGIKKHFCRKHGEKKWKCEKCSKIYAVLSDWKAHSKTCGTREYRCDCGTLFSRKDSFTTHRAFCDALAEESARLSAQLSVPTAPSPTAQIFSATPLLHPQSPPTLFPFAAYQHHFPNTPPHITFHPSHSLQNSNPNPNHNPVHVEPETFHLSIPPPPISSSSFYQPPPPLHKALIASPFRSLHVSTQDASSAATSSSHLSATALLQKAATMGAQPGGHVASTMSGLNVVGIFPEYVGFNSGNLDTWQNGDHLTRDFLGLTEGCGGVGSGDVDGGVKVNVSMSHFLSLTGGIEFPLYDPHRSFFKSQLPTLPIAEAAQAFI